MDKKILTLALAGAMSIGVFSLHAQDGSVLPQDSVKVSQTTSMPEPEKKEDEGKKEDKKWYQKLSLGGYAQVRYNRFLETNEKLKCDQCDKSIGEGQGLFFRRARLKLSGDVHNRVYLYVQVDVATNATSGSTQGLNYLQLRDFYVDIFLDKAKTFKVRPGLSKVPVGFDVLQSSQNRIAFDRSDGMNSAAYNERDMGAFLYWTPTVAKERYKFLQNDKLKGSGDYGVLGFGVYNGQTANRPELNDDLHVVAKASFPFKFGEQYLEIGGHAYTGLYNVGEVATGTYRQAGDTYTIRTYDKGDYLDQRVGLAIIKYAQPFGFQAEYNIGEGPAFTKNNDGSYSIEKKPVEGGYAQVMFTQTIKKMTFTPYVRYQYYRGGKKNETDARWHDVHETEAGVEWQLNKYIEFTAAYMMSDRVFEDAKNPVNAQYGNLLRLQLQVNY